MTTETTGRAERPLHVMLAEMIEWLDHAVAVARENPPLIEPYQDDSREPRVLALTFNDEEAELVARGFLVDLAAALPAFEPYARWFGDEVAEALDNRDPEFPGTLDLLVKARQVERFRARLGDL